MSDTDKPEVPPATPESAPAPAEEPAPAAAKPQPPFIARPPRGPRPQGQPRKVPALRQDEGFGRDVENFGASAPRLKDLDAEIEGELQAAMGGLSDKDIYGDPQQHRPKTEAGAAPGRKVGKVLSVHGPDVFVDVPGGRSQGVLPLTQFPEGPPAPGTEVEIHIEGYDAANGLLLLTRKGAAVEADWSSVAVGMTVEARVTETNKGGLAVEINGIRGFMPISQIDLYRVENTEQYVNQRLLCLVTEVDREERNLVVSRRALLEKEREENREKLWNSLEEGQVRDGIVRSVRDFGAFVDLGGADGLLHISEMSWSRVENAASVVQPGQAIKVVVLKIDREKRKISLGLKQLLPSPWDNIDAKYPIGQVVPGKVTRLAEFGAFVELEPGVEGLIHISELAPQRVFRVRDIVQVGQQVQVMVLRVDPGARKLSLSLKQALPKPAPEPEEEEEEEVADVKPPRPRTTPLRGGIGEG
jgi:small subunit ribosomal protein S1